MLCKSLKNLSYSKNILVTYKTYKVSVSHLHILKTPVCTVNRRLLIKDQRSKLGAFIARYESSNAAEPTITEMADVSSGANVVPQIPDLPEPVAATEVILELNKLGEPTLSSLGLAHWTPPGLIQSLLEFLHVSGGLPWWGSICVVVISARILLFPAVISSQRSSVRMGNDMPKLQLLQANMTEAKISGDIREIIKASQELSVFMKKSEVNPIKNFMTSMIQAPVFVCFFLGLRDMANAPVESMMHGGMLWFYNLTLPDQYYVLPLITATTLWITMEVGVYGKLSASSGTALSAYMPYVIKIIPIIVFPFIMNFPSAILVYWATNNLVSLLQVSFLRVPKVREYFNIQQKVVHKPGELLKKKGFITDMTSAYSNMKITRQIEERERLDQMSFQRAGRAPPVKTYKYDPTLVRPRHIAEAKKQ